VVAAIITVAFIVVRLFIIAQRIIIVVTKPGVVSSVLDLNKAVLDDNHENALNLTYREENVDVREKRAKYHTALSGLCVKVVNHITALQR
jgi:hypothetical protein